jgi:hypothetical protein
VVAGVSLVDAWHTLADRWSRLRLLLLAGLGLALVTGFAAILAEIHVIPSGPTLSFWGFGFEEEYGLTQLVVTFAAWAVWFALSAWCLAWGAARGIRGFVNLGVVCIGLGVIVRFFDLAVNLATTGWLFVVGGLLLGAVAWAMEYWRRYLLRRMEVMQ